MVSSHTILTLPDVINNLSKKTTFIIVNKTVTITFIEILLCSVCFLSDYFVFKDEKLKKFIYSKSGIETRYIHVLLDNGSHSLIGVLSYLVFSIPNISISNLFLCGFISSIIDIDHFISAKSLSLTDAVSLTKRPFLHNTTTLFIINLLLLFYFIIYKPKLRYISILIFLSWFSHHLRDANRHGLWFGNEIHTEPIKDELYVVIICLLPLILRFLNENL